MSVHTATITANMKTWDTPIKAEKCVQGGQLVMNMIIRNGIGEQSIGIINGLIGVISTAKWPDTDIIDVQSAANFSRADRSRFWIEFNLPSSSLLISHLPPFPSPFSPSPPLGAGGLLLFSLFLFCPLSGSRFPRSAVFCFRWYSYLAPLERLI